MLKCRVLVVEDERIVALNLQQRLTKLGYEVPAIVASGEQALQKMQSLHPDLVLMDSIRKRACSVRIRSSRSPKTVA